MKFTVGGQTIILNIPDPPDLRVWIPNVEGDKLIFVNGIINNTCASNIYKGISFNDDQNIIADVNVSKTRLSFDIKMGDPDTFIEDEEDFPPTRVKILLGKIIGGQPVMLRKNNLTLIPIETRRGEGGSSMKRYFSWLIAEIEPQGFYAP